MTASKPHEDRAGRLAEKLRENLRRRKAQARARREGEDGDGRPESEATAPPSGKHGRPKRA